MPPTTDRRLPSMTVADAMDADPVCVPAGTPLQEVITQMDARRAGGVLVVGPNRELLGIFTERDLIRRVAHAADDWRAVPVREYMTPTPHAVRPDAGWDEAIEAMTRYGVRRLPVVDDAGRVVGIVSTRLLMVKRQDYLTRYVADRTRDLDAAHQQLLARDSEVLFNLRAAGELQQRALLPQAHPDWPEHRWAIHFQPYDHLGGDYYDFARPTDSHLGFLIADASGHSIPAAIIAIMARFAFRNASATSTSPGEVLGLMNRQLAALSDERFVTACYCVFDRAAQKIVYASAGHPPPLLLRGREVTPLHSPGFILGIVADEVYTGRETPTMPGDRIVFTTDGVTEARNEIGEMYGTERLRATLVRHADLPCQALMDEVRFDLSSFSGTVPASDDVTLAVVEILS